MAVSATLQVTATNRVLKKNFTHSPRRFNLYTEILFTTKSRTLVSHAFILFFFFFVF